MKQIKITSIFLIILILINPIPLHASNINLDTAFTPYGYITNPSGHSGRGIILQQSQNQIVLAGYANTGINNYAAAFLIRYLQNGNIDSTFGGTGIGYVTTTTIGDQSFITGIAQQSTGSIIVTGTTYQVTDLTTSKSFIARYSADGILDTSFGGSGTGFYVLPLLSYNSASSIAMQADGKIVITGSAFNGTTNEAFIARFSFDGIFDTSFNYNETPGFVTTLIGTTVQPNSIALQSSGNIIIAGQVDNNQMFIASYLTDGNLNPNFGSGGITTTTVPNSSQSGIFGLAIQANDLPVVTGYAITSLQEVCTARYTTSGTIDTTFGSNGYFLTSILQSAVANAIIIGTNNEILVTGTTNDGMGENKIFIIRYISESTANSLLNLQGLIITDILTNYTTPGNYSSYAIGLPSADQITVLGSNTYSIFIAQYLDTGVPAPIGSTQKLYGDNPQCFSSFLYIDFYAKVITDQVAQAAAITLVENIISDFTAAYANQSNFNYFQSASTLLHTQLDQAQYSLTTLFPNSRLNIEEYFHRLKKRITLLAQI